jgi:hypothetical protein
MLLTLKVFGMTVFLGRKKRGSSVWGIKARFGADASNGSLFGLSSLRVLPTLIQPNDSNQRDRTSHFYNTFVF